MAIFATIVLAGGAITNPNLGEIGFDQFDLGDLESLTSEVRYRYSFEVPDYITETGSFLLFAVPWVDARSTAEAVSYESRRFPTFEWTRRDTTSERIAITLPPSYEPVELPSEMNHTSPVGD